MTHAVVPLDDAGRVALGREGIDAPAGTLLLVGAGTKRAASAVEAGTTVPVIGGKPPAPCSRSRPRR